MADATMTDALDEAYSFEVVGKDDDWAMVEGGDLKGMKTGTDRNTGLVVSLSSRHCCDVDRWTTMPSLEQYGSLKELDLYKCRYIQQLHESVCGLEKLEILILFRCEKLKSLPQEIGQLKNLRVVSNGLTEVGI
jgi:hypothetical protein